MTPRTLLILEGDRPTHVETTHEALRGVVEHAARWAVLNRTMSVGTVAIRDGIIPVTDGLRALTGRP